MQKEDIAFCRHCKRVKKLDDLTDYRGYLVCLYPCLGELENDDVESLNYAQEEDD